MLLSFNARLISKDAKALWEGGTSNTRISCETPLLRKANLKKVNRESDFSGGVACHRHTMLRLPAEGFKG